MTETRLQTLAEDLDDTGAEWVILDAHGRVAAGSRPAGDDVAHWIPGWSSDAVDRPRRSSDDRWILLHRLFGAGGQTLYLVLDRTCEYVAEEARLLEARRTAQAELAGATAREMNDAMTIVQGRLELLRAFALQDPTSAERHCAIALEHAQHAAETLHDLRLVGAVTPAEVGSVSVLPTVRQALAQSGLPPERVQIDVHPPDLEVLGRNGPVGRVFTAVFRSMGVNRENLSLSARRSGDVVRIDLVVAGRRRTDLDSLQLGIIAALLDALGGALAHTNGGLMLALPADEGESRDLAPLTERGDLLVVGHPYLADRVTTLLGPDAVTVRTEPTAESAMHALGDDGVVGLVTQLLLPERCGLELYRKAQRVRPDLPLGPLVVTADSVSRLPRDVRCVVGPLTRSRLVRGLRV